MRHPLCIVGWHNWKLIDLEPIHERVCRRCGKTQGKLVKRWITLADRGLLEHCKSIRETHDER
jgi:hypothetical protein